MRALHLPVNVASIPSHTVRALREIGVDASGLVLGNATVQSCQGLTVVDNSRPRHSARWARDRMRWLWNFVTMAARADVIHWYFGTTTLPWGLDLSFVHSMGKPGIVEWLGSDIRIPEVEFEENPFYAAAWDSGYEYRQIESLEASRHRQGRFSAIGFAAAASTGMLQYLQGDLFPKPYLVAQRLMLRDYEPAYPDPTETRPLVVHSPTAPQAKGTGKVLEVIDQLKQTLDFRFRLIQGMPRPQSLKAVAEADIFLDQFVLGDRGMASLEAMALGKPVVCYIKPSLAGQYPAGLPIVNADQHHLADALETLIGDGYLRLELGRRGRKYVEQHHDALSIARQLRGIYEELLNRHAHT